MFDEKAKTKALAIVSIFETSKPFGDYSACVVLNDGAGISYGASQFTHRSGSLAAVIERCESLGGTLPHLVKDALPDLRSGRNIPKRSGDNALKTALRRLGRTPEMQQAQREIAFEKYLNPAIEACKGSSFVMPLSLAVIYDSMNHGSWAKIRDRVKNTRGEKDWITNYVQARDKWLESIPRLAPTDYRTDFFLAQIARGNWNLDLPLNVHGFKLTEDILFPAAASSAPASPEQVEGIAGPVPTSVNEPVPSVGASDLHEDEQAPGSPNTAKETAPPFDATTVKQYIPKMQGAKRWFGTLSLGGIASTTLAAFNGLPPWAVFCLGMVTAAVVIGFAFIIVKYRSNLFDLVKHVISINADPNTNNIELTPEQ